MSRTLLILTVALAAYAALNIAASIAVALIWRFRIVLRRDTSPVVRARRLLWLRAVPALVSSAITGAVVMPAFAIFEPDRASEIAGPLLLALATIASAQILIALHISIATTVRTRAAARAWLRDAVPLDVDPPAGVPAFAIDSAAPIVALVGVFRPRLVAARSVIESCTAGELATIVAHERGHLHSCDNLKRWLMACAPDALRCTPIHHEIATAWHDAAEDAADDAATPGDATARVDLAALLIKIARLTPEPVWPAATVSPFVEPGGLDRRVRRLLASEASVTASGRRGFLAIPLLATVIATAMVMRPETLQRVYDFVETVVAFGR